MQGQECLTVAPSGVTATLSSLSVMCWGSLRVSTDPDPKQEERRFRFAIMSFEFRPNLELFPCSSVVWSHSFVRLYQIIL